MNKKCQLSDIFKNLKFKEDFLIIHSDLLSFYKFKFDINFFFNTLSRSLGKNKTLIFPSFNLVKRRRWFLNKTKGESGSLSEYVRKNLVNIRTLNPLHSICIYGPKKKQIPIDKCLSSFGKNSSWEWLCENKKVRNISLGIDLVGGATICHYPEEKAGVYYRKYEKIDTNVYNSKDKLLKKKFTFFARKKGYINSWLKCQKDLKKKKNFYTSQKFIQYSNF